MSLSAAGKYCPFLFYSPASLWKSEHRLWKCSQPKTFYCAVLLLILKDILYAKVAGLVLVASKGSQSTFSFNKYQRWNVEGADISTTDVFWPLVIGSKIWFSCVYPWCPVYRLFMVKKNFKKPHERLHFVTIFWWFKYRLSTVDNVRFRSHTGDLKCSEMSNEMSGPSIESLLHVRILVGVGSRAKHIYIRGTTF